VIAQKFNPAGGISFCTHDHEIIPQSGPVEFKGTPSFHSHLAMPPQSAKSED
jgi:hypothetical protein